MDSFLLVSPQGSAFDLGSWVDLSGGGPDFDLGAVREAQFTDSPGGDGGRLAFERSRVRRFRFPLILASGGAGLSLDALRGALVQAARPGAYIDLGLHGTATAERPRFDVEAGRLLDAHYVRLREAGRERAELELDVQPFGYWPTWITLASAASVGLPGQLAIPSTAFIGDVPALARVVIAPSGPTTYTVGSALHDTLMWSLAGRPSLSAHWAAASFLPTPVTASVAADPFSAGAQALYAWPTSAYTAAGSHGFAELTRAVIPSALADAYRGEFRAFAWARLSPSQAHGWQLSADVVPHSNIKLPLASAQPVATIPPDAGNPTFANASPAYNLLDLGVLSFPPVGTAQAYDTALRLWVKAPSTTNVGSPMIRLGGVFLQPLDGPAGVLTKGLIIMPGFTSAGFRQAGRLSLDGAAGEIIVRRLSDNVVGANPIGDYRGQLPQVGPSTNRLDLDGARLWRLDPAGPPIRAGEDFAAASVTYRPRFTFQKTL